MTDPTNKSYELFRYGSTWVRADFHLHTKQDREFVYTGAPDRFIADYIQGLQKSEIKAGVVANHNKFDHGEYTALKKAALKEGIFLLPGVELSVNDGANGIHTIVVFSDDWLVKDDFISQFLAVAFEGKASQEYENKNARCSFGLIETIKKLEGYQKDFFLVFAHVERESGLWNELDGGRIQDLGKNEFFRRRALAFQQVRTHDVPDRNCRVKAKIWLGDSYPAEIEGSDCKALSDIGRGEKKSYVKIGDFNFEAIKFALLDYKHRVSAEPQKHEMSHILSANFEGGVLDGKTIFFSPELNALIGIRGSGKSSILEAVRYALEIPFGEKASDTGYKERLVEHVLGSGGKVTVHAVDRRGQAYEIRRILKEQPDIYINGVLQPGISIRETILHKPIYFGQKDLSSTGEGFEKDLVEKLVGEKLSGIRMRIDTQRQKVSETVESLKRLSTTEEKKKEFQLKKQDAEFRLKYYKDHGVEEKLQKQVDFDADSRKCSQVVSFVKTYLADLEELINRYEDEIKNQRIYKSKQNDPFFEAFYAGYDKIAASFSQIKVFLSDNKKTYVELQEKAKTFEKLKDGLKEEFAAIERKLADELKDAGVKAIKPDEFRQLRHIVDQAAQMLEALEKQESQYVKINQDLRQELAILNELWLEEYRTIQAELEKVNRNNSSLVIKVEFKGDKNAFVGFIKDIFRGSRLKEATFINLIEKFPDFGSLYRDLENAKTIVGGSGPVFEEYFNNNLSALLTWQVPNRFIIEYQGKELMHHSLGQRASALILFVLSQQENDVIIIDQPEDDLDNQTIYEDVIKLIIGLKPRTQFIFATHNANFPVLGDAEQIVVCVYSDDSIAATCGSIDRQNLQKEIVDIMEGGEEAFRQRKRIYEIWKPRNS